MDAPNDGVQFDLSVTACHPMLPAARVGSRASIGGNVRRGYNAPCRANARPARCPFLRSEEMGNERDEHSPGKARYNPVVHFPLSTRENRLAPQATLGGKLSRSNRIGRHHWEHPCIIN